MSLLKYNNNNNRSNMGRKLRQQPSNEGTTQFTREQFISKYYTIYNNMPSQKTSTRDKLIFKKTDKYLSS